MLVICFICQRYGLQKIVSCKILVTSVKSLLENNYSLLDTGCEEVKCAYQGCYLVFGQKNNSCVLLL